MSIRWGVFYSGISMGSNYLLPLAAIPFLTRTLSSEAFGQLVIAQAVAVILCQLVDFGFILAGSRKAAIIDNKVELSSFFSVVQSARFLLLLLSLLVLAILAVSSILPIPLLVLVAAALPAVVGNYLQAVWFFQGRALFGWLALTNFLSKVFYFLLVVFFVTKDSDLVLASLGFGFSYVIGGSALCCILFSMGIRWRPVLEKDRILDILRDGAQSFLSLAFLSLHMQVLVAAVGVVGGTSAAGVLSTADKFLRGIAAATSPIASALFPTFSRMYASADPAVGSLRRKALGLMLLIAIPSCLFLFLFSEYISYLLFPEQSRGLTVVIRMFSIVPVFACIGVLYGGLTLVPSGYDGVYLRAIFFAEMGGVLTFILLALWGDEFFGAWTLVVTEVSLGMGMFLLATAKLREKRGL
ncbi:TPA: oligosaccharide flippase family protein [Pseudomonas aeruginosa]|uniref:oligosaccharide flippase family protein n=1 Tax=Pseudomonas aeruginosa TaxID=287 RepID=UPI0009A30CB9|nr:oligosaccharide flippase family protein [Pseudomonas aeruginosa]